MKNEHGKIRVLIAKPGLDGHDRGAKVIARALRDAGFEVIYTGLHQTPEMIVNAAVDEDVHVVGLSILSGAHKALVPEVINGIKKAGAEYFVQRFGPNGVALNKDADGVPQYEPISEVGLEALISGT